MKYTVSNGSHGYFLDEETISVRTKITGQHIELKLAELMPDGLLRLDHNFWWNGSSFVQDTPECMRASAFHDALCQMISRKLLPRSTRPVADKLYYDLCREDGMSWMQAKIRLIGLVIYRTVSIIG